MYRKNSDEQNISMRCSGTHIFGLVERDKNKFCVIFLYFLYFATFLSL